MDDTSEFRLVRRKRRPRSTLHERKELYIPKNADQHEEMASATSAVASVYQRIDDIRSIQSLWNTMNDIIPVVRKHRLAYANMEAILVLKINNDDFNRLCLDKVSCAIQNIYRNQTDWDKSLSKIARRIHANSDRVPHGRVVYLKMGKECEPHEEVDGSSVNKERHMTDETLETCGTISQLVCYGLGNFAECYIARYQLAFLEALRIKFEVPSERALIYDPKFCNVEKMVLEKLGYTVLRNNEEGKREFACKGVSLVFMPHCGKGLYNNLLWSNWSPRLQNLIIIGNSFSRIVLSTPKRLLLTTGNFILKVQPYTTEEGMPLNSKFSDVFNDTVIHTFFQNSCPDVDEEFWDRGPEPVYNDEDAEMILNK